MSKPFPAVSLGIGAVAGAALVSILGFTNGWVISAHANETQIADVKIDMQAKVCASLAANHLKADKSGVNLDGYQEDAREARDKLARRFVVTLQGETEANSQVVSACAQMLNPSNG